MAILIAFIFGINQEPSKDSRWGMWSVYTQWWVNHISDITKFLPKKLEVS